MTDFITFKENLQNLQNTGIAFSNNLHSISTIVESIFDHIKISQTVESAQVYFTMLDATQSILALLVHEYDLEIPAQLWRFMKDFDNSEEAKYTYFERIKTGEYKF